MLRSRFLICSTIFCIATVLGCDQSPHVQDGKTAEVNGEQIVGVSQDDEEMNAAMQKARDTMQQFMTKMNAAGQEFDGMLKVYFDEPGVDDGEHMWVIVSQANSPNFKGTLISTPGWLTSVKNGDEVDFDLSRISDWLYIEDGLANGAYTVQLLRSRMSDAERRDHDSHYPFKFE